MGQKVINDFLIDKNLDDSVKFSLYMFMMKLIGQGIYKRYDRYQEVSM